MNIIIIDASQKRASVRSRRILSRWLPQLGPDTYSGRLSEEGLRDLASELRSSASRHTSIAIHRVVSRDRQELVTIIGNRAAFDTEGRWAFRTKGRTLDVAVLTPLARVLHECVTLSGLFHDLGKLNLQFNKYLRGQADPQRIRHDVLGYWIVQRAQGLAIASSSIKSDEAWLLLARDPVAFFAHAVDDTGKIQLSGKWVASLTSADPVSGADEEIRTKTLYNPAFRKNYPLALAVSWLVLTHHHLIQPKPAQTPSESEQLPGFTLGRHVQAHVPMVEHLNLTTIAADVPWKNSAWCTAVTRCCEALTTLIKENPSVLEELRTLDYSALFAHMLYYQRPALIIADQLASVMQEDVLARKRALAPFLPDRLYANSVGRSPDVAGDFLHTHLRSVGRKSGFVSRLLAQADERFFPYVDAATLPSTGLLRASPEPNSPFYWQTRAADVVAAIADIESRPFFAVLLSAPGSGKTVAGPKLLSAASGGRFRATVGLTMKSLTLQTGRSYVEKMGFSGADVATMVGDRAARLLFDANRDDASTEQGAPQLGSESLESEEDNFVFAGNDSDIRGSWLQMLQPEHRITASDTEKPGLQPGVFSRKQQRMIDAPVLICTIDHIVRAAEAIRSNDAKAILRIASSDLVLDEIDGYSTSDLVTLGKLVFIHGLYGRRVVLMSGTLSQTLAVSLHRMWLSGIKLAQQRTGKPRPTVALLVSNLTEPVALEGVSDTTFSEEASRFCSDFAAALEIHGSKVWPLELPVSPNTDTGASWPEEVVQGALELHRAHRLVDAGSGKGFSAGFIRMNRVASAQELATHLMNREAALHEPNIRVVCYHARYPTIVRAFIEDLLDGAFNRSNHPVPAHPDIQSAIRNASKPDVVVIVCTTSIEETGRDHDFDWAILEPSSERSAIQAAGRVLRHRAVQPASPNLFVMATTVSALEGKDLPYGRAGIQDNKAFASTKDWLVVNPVAGGPLASSLNSSGIGFTEGAGVATVAASELLPLQTWAPRLTPKGTLLAPKTYEDSRLGALAHVELMARLGTPAQPRQVSLEGFFQSGGNGSKDVLWLDARHAKHWRFRSSTPLPELQVCLSTKDTRRFRVMTEEGLVGDYIAHETPAIRYPERALLRLDEDFDSRFEALRKRNDWGMPVLSVLGQGSTRYDNKKLASGAAFSYHPLLGFALPS